MYAKSSPASPHWIAASFSGLVTGVVWGWVVTHNLTRGTSSAEKHLLRFYWLFLSFRHWLITHKDIINSWWREKWWWIIRSLFSTCMSSNKLGSTHHSCLASLFTVSCCTVFFTFYRFSIWSLYLLVFSIYCVLKGSIEHWYYLRKKSVWQILIAMSGVKVAVHFYTKKY